MTEWTYIEWLDSNSFGDGWMDPKDLVLDMPLVYTVGHVLCENDSSVLVVPSLWYAKDGKISQAHGAMHIPKVSIQKREILKRQHVHPCRSQNHLHPSKHNKAENGRATHSRSRYSRTYQGPSE